MFLSPVLYCLLYYIVRDYKYGESKVLMDLKRCKRSRQCKNKRIFKNLQYLISVLKWKYMDSYVEKFYTYKRMF